MWYHVLRKAILVVGLIACCAGNALAICKNTPINPVTDVCWQCMFPMRFAGSTFGRNDDEAPGKTDAAICGCADPSTKQITMGMSVGFWEQARLIETVKDPWCMTSLGAGMNTSGNFSAIMSGGHSSLTSSGTNSQYSSTQVHYYIFPSWNLLGYFYDLPCIERHPFDIAYMSEVDPLWSDDTLSFIINPEALLFGNPIAQLACAADSVAAAVWKPLDPLFWCAGSWGSAYPLDGSSNLANPTHLNAGMANRMIFKLGRELLLRDMAIDNCARGGILTPIEIKSHYRLQIAKPVRGSDCIPVGRSDFIWGAAKNPVMGTGNNAPDNFLWVLTRANTCCIGYTYKGSSN